MKLTIEISSEVLIKLILSSKVDFLFFALPKCLCAVLQFKDVVLIVVSMVATVCKLFYLQQREQAIWTIDEFNKLNASCTNLRWVLVKCNGVFQKFSLQVIYQCH